MSDKLSLFWDTQISKETSLMGGTHIRLLVFRFQVQLLFGSAPYVGLGALVFAMLVLIELFG